MYFSIIAQQHSNLLVYVYYIKSKRQTTENMFPWHGSIDYTCYYRFGIYKGFPMMPISVGITGGPGDCTNEEDLRRCQEWAEGWVHLPWRMY